MAATIMNAGDTESKVFTPKADFGVVVRVLNGAIAGDWLFHISPDKEHWTPAHDVPFSTSKLTDIITIPNGFFCKLMGGTGNNLKVDIGYMPNAVQPQISIEGDIED